MRTNTTRNSLRRPGAEVRAGFTLVEVMVVTIIMAILAAIVIPMATGSTDMEASAAARTIASDLQYAQNMAISFQSGANGAINGVKVVFATSNTPGAGSYKLINDDNKSSALINPMTAEAYNVVFTSAADMGDVCLTSTTFAQKHGRIRRHGRTVQRRHRHGAGGHGGVPGVSGGLDGQGDGDVRESVERTQRWWIFG